MQTAIALIDDNALFRKGLAALLNQQPDLRVLDEMPGGRDVVHNVCRLDAAVIVMDVKLSSSNGIDVAAQIKHRTPRTRILMLTDSRMEEHVHGALRAGADGYVLKDASLEEVLLAVRSAANGKKYLSPDISGHLVSSFLYPEQNKTPESRLHVLTSRERSVLQLIAEGRTNRGAAEYLSVSPKTVEKHRASLMLKLGLKSATDLVLAAMELGVVDRPLPFASRAMGMNPPAMAGMAGLA